MKTGVVLISAVIMLAVLCYLSLSIFENVQRVSTLYRERMNFRRAFNASTVSLGERMRNISIDNDPDVVQVKFEGRSGPTIIQEAVLLLPLQGPRLNLEKLFSNGTVCPVNGGICRGAVSLCTYRVCDSLGAGATALIGSLLTAEPLRLPAAAPALLAATGDMELFSILLDSEAIILAGGNLSIQSLFQRAGNRLTLISLRGAIEVGVMRGPRNVSAWAKEGVSVPVDLIADNGLWPEELGGEILGIIPGY